MDVRDFEDVSQREKRTFHKLGIAADKASGKYAGKFYSLPQMINEAGINQYATMDVGCIHAHDPVVEFNFAKLREMQNLEWSEDSIF